MREILRKITNAFFIFGFFIIGYMVAIRYNDLPPQVVIIISILPYMLFFICAVLCMWFQQSKMFFYSIFLIFSYIILSNTFQNIFQNQQIIQVYINGFAIIIPLNILLLLLCKERGIVSIYGAFKTLIVLLQLFYIIQASVKEESFLSNIKCIETLNKVSNDTILIPRVGIILIVITVCILIIKYIIESDIINIAFVVSLISFYVSLHVFKNTFQIHVFYTVVFVVINIAIMQASYSMAYYDQLTGILSRRALEQEMMRIGNWYTIAMIDIDHFKNFNDKYGHNVGDEVLRMVSAMINKVHGGKAFRYGGEEFTIIFNRKGIDKVEDIVEELRIAISKRPLVIRGKNRPKKKPNKKYNAYHKRKNREAYITISIGLAEKIDRYKNSHDVIKAADRALYKAKKNGRNRIEK